MIFTAQVLDGAIVKFWLSWGFWIDLKSFLDENEKGRKQVYGMTFVRNAVGYGLAGLWAMSIWDALAASVLGLWGGWLAALIIIGTMWLLNHHLGLIRHAPQATFIDMAFGIAFTGVARDVFLRQDLNALWSSLPTIGVVALGGALGGYLAWRLERALQEDA